MVSNPVFPNLEGMIDDRGIKVSAICKKIGVSPKSLHNKRVGRSQFTWNEACTIQEAFFPDIEMKILFAIK